MNPGISMITLGVSDLQKSVELYEVGPGFAGMESPPGVAFFTLNGSWLGLYSRESLAADAMLPATGTGFGHFTASHNVESETEVDGILEQAVSAGATLVKSATECGSPPRSGCWAWSAARQGIQPGKFRQIRAAVCAFICAIAAVSAPAETSITINGRTIQATGGNITVTNETVIVDGNVIRNNVVAGSGKISSDIRTPGAFRELQLDIAGDVIVTRGETTRCIVTADDNILPLILTESRDGVLRISATDGFASSNRIEINLQVPMLVKAAINGSGHITLTDVARDVLALVISGSGDISAHGMVNNLTATINGSGRMNAADLESGTATVIINGSGSATVSAKASLAAEVNGSGAVRYSGTPQKVHTAVRGSGSITGK